MGSQKTNNAPKLARKKNQETTVQKIYPLEKTVKIDPFKALQASPLTSQQTKTDRQKQIEYFADGGWRQQLKTTPTLTSKQLPLLNQSPQKSLPHTTPSKTNNASSPTLSKIKKIGRVADAVIDFKQLATSRKQPLPNGARIVSKAGLGVLSIPSTKDKIKKAIQTRTKADIADAIANGANTMRTLLEGVQATSPLAQQFYIRKKAYEQAYETARFLGLAPDLSKRIAAKAAKKAFDSASRQALRAITRKETISILRPYYSRQAARATGISLGKKLASVVPKATQSAQLATTRAFSIINRRLKISIVALDVVEATAIQNNPNSPVTKKAAAWIAAGSSAADLAISAIPHPAAYAVSFALSVTSLVSSLIRDNIDDETPSPSNPTP